ncbi:MAG TPA: diacylglycerol kinase family protein [Longimicrobiales bacterium]
MKIALIAKPGGEAVIKELRTAVRSLRKTGYQVTPRLTFDHNDAVRFARTAVRRQFDLVIAAGGDGTINQVVNGLVGSGALELPRLAIIPLGTANDFAKGLGIPQTIPEAFDVALRGVPTTIDVADLNGRCFVNVSTGGFGPDITEAASSKSKARFGKMAYLFTAVRKLAELEPARAQFKVDGRVLYEGPFFFFAVGNARHTGGGTPVTPRADYSDAQLDVVVVTGEKRRDFLSLLPDLRAGKHPEDPDVLYVKGRDVRVKPFVPIAVNADGEPIRGEEFHYHLRGQQITVMRT